jgi:O-antigen/teichoic acid export membrane protein
LGEDSGIGKTSATGGFKLFIGVSISSVLTAVSLIVVLWLLSNPDDYGIITTAMIFPLMLSFFKDWGISSAMIKYIAQYKSEEKHSSIKNVMLSGAMFELAMGVLLTLISFFMAEYLAINVFMLPEVKPLIEVASLTILADTFLKISQSTFVGLEKMEYHSLTQILNSVMRFVLAPLLVWMGFSVMGAIQGQIVAQLTAGIVGLIFFSKFFNNISKNATEKTELIKTLKVMLKYGLPLSVGIIVTGFLPQFYNTILTQSFEAVNRAGYTTALGNYQTAINFTVVITFFTIPISTVLFPAFSKIKGDYKKEVLNSVFQKSVKYSTLLTIPVVLMLMVLAEPLVFALLPEYTDAPLFLTLQCVPFLYVGVGSMSLGNFFNGQGKTRTTMLLSLLTLISGLIVSILLIPEFGVIGLIFTNILSQFPKTVIGLWWINKQFQSKLDWMSTIKILLASCIAFAVTYLLLLQLNGFSYWIQLISGAIVFLGVYLVAAPLIRAVDKEDVESLRDMLSGLGPFSPIFNLPLLVIEKLLDVFSFKREKVEP